MDIRDGFLGPKCLAEGVPKIILDVSNEDFSSMLDKKSCRASSYATCTTCYQCDLAFKPAIDHAPCFRNRFVMWNSQVYFLSMIMIREVRLLKHKNWWIWSVMSHLPLGDWSCWSYGTHLSPNWTRTHGNLCCGRESNLVLSKPEEMLWTHYDTKCIPRAGDNRELEFMPFPFHYK